MKIRNKILLVLLTFLLLSGVIITSIWYVASRSLMNTYLKNMSESTMLDAYHAFEYILMDTSYMATLISTNEKNIIEPVSRLRQSLLKPGGQWGREYLDNRRVIMDYIRGMNGYKYYISGIAVASNEDCIFSTNYIIQDKAELYKAIQRLDQERLETSMVMMEPVHLEGLKSTVSSDYVVPAVRGITGPGGELSGYVILYFDYGVIDRMFSANLPKGSRFQVVNEQNLLIYSNCGDDTSIFDKQEKGYEYHTFLAQDVGWNFHMAIPAYVYIVDIQRTTLLTGVVMVALLLLAGMVSILSISRMTTEITVLNERMNQFSRGEMGTRYEIKSRDEIGQMGHTFNHMVVRIQELMEKITQEERQKRLNELAFLQAQINPHFISNVLNNAAWMARLRHADNLVQLLNSLNSLLQNVMHAKEGLILMSEELDYVDIYLTMIEYSGSYDFILEKDIDEEVKNLYIPRFILQPIIENAIYHGLPQDLSKQGKIRITARRAGTGILQAKEEKEEEEEKLIITVEDNGPGLDRQEMEQMMKGKSKGRKAFNGIGIVNVNERIQLFFGKEYGLHYESEQGSYTRCIFTLPLVKETDDRKQEI